MINTKIQLKETLQKRLKQRTINNELPPYVYTYPPKGSYSPCSPCDDWQKALKSWHTVTGDITLYAHIPFCAMKCSFCDLFTVTNFHKEEIVNRYVNSLLKELEIMKKYLNINQLTVSALYFGGGTPGLLSKEHLRLLLTTFQSTFHFNKHAEISIESTPNALSIEKLNDFKKLGFNRLSIGIQSFQDQDLMTANRHYGAKLGYEIAYEAVKNVGIKNVNLDLIYGLPYQTLEQWKDNLEKTLEIAPQTITVYPLVVRQRTTIGKTTRNLLLDNFIQEKIRYEWFDETVKILNNAGYEQKSFVSFAKKGGGCQYEEQSFLGCPTLSFGAGARKYAPTMHYVDDDYINRKPNKMTFLEYMDNIEKGIIPIKSVVIISKKEQMLRFIILGLLSSGISIVGFKKLFNVDVLQEYSIIFESLKNENLIMQKNNLIKLTTKGLKYSSIIADTLSSNFVKNTKVLYQ